MDRKSKSILRVRISKKDFKYLKEIAKKTRCKICIKKKRGLPFLINKYRKRKIFVITLLVIAIFIFGLTRFVWNIEISCDGKIEENEILSLLNEKGIYEGILISKIDTDKIINEILLERDDISWMGIKITGTNVIVSIKVATEKAEIIDTDEACNIVSDKQGEITKITVQNGTARVNVR